MAIKAPSREFRVSWDGKKKRFVARDHNGALLGSSHGRDGAIASAVRYANLVAGQGYQVIVMMETDGKFKKNYVAEPRPPLGPKGKAGPDSKL